jgi:hypothetical protein
MSEKLQGILVDLFCALIVFAAGYYLHGVMNRNVSTTVVGKTIEFTLPGRKDTVTKYLPVIKEKVSKDSTQFWRGKYDSLRTAGPVSDTAKQDDPLFTRHLLPFKVIIRDDWTRNHLTVFPLNTDSDRVRVDLTEYDSLKFSVPYQDTTTNVIRIEQSWWDTWYFGALGTAAVFFVLSR